MKKFLIGVLVGCLLMMTTPALADSILQSIDVVMNGVNVQVDGENVEVNSILYNGSTYLPMRKVAELVGKDVNWEQSTMTANIVDIEKEGDNITIYTDNGAIINGEEYYTNGYVFDFIKNHDNILWNIYGMGDDTKIALIEVLDDGTEKKIIDSVPFLTHEDKAYISKNYYETTILPLIQK